MYPFDTTITGMVILYHCPPILSLYNLHLLVPYAIAQNVNHIVCIDLKQKNLTEICDLDLSLPSYNTEQNPPLCS